MVCGYKRTGKDELCRMFNMEDIFRWSVYRHPDVNQDSGKFVVEAVNRISFADKLRADVNKIWNIDNSIDYESIREKEIVDGKTYRDLLIEHAAVKRADNPDYWIIQAADWEDVKGNIMITDWRYENELSYLKRIQNINVTTIRVFRSEVSVPPFNVISEHQLDGVFTDYLLVPHENTDEEFNQAKSVFPQYRNYIPAEIVYR